MFCRVEPVELSFATALTAFADCFIIEKECQQGGPCQGFFSCFSGPSYVSGLLTWGMGRCRSEAEVTDLT